LCSAQPDDSRPRHSGQHSEAPLDSGDSQTPVCAPVAEHPTLVSPDLPDGVTVALLEPDQGLLPDGAPVVVVFHGGTEPDSIPLVASVVNQPRYGLARLYVNFPGGSSDLSTAGDNDYRGPRSRQVGALALQYAGGLVRDDEGCLLAERATGAISAQPPLVYGHSNGVALAVATLADSSLELPDLTGLVAWEPPSNAQFATIELGLSGEPSSDYQGCEWDGSALICAAGYGSLGWEATLYHDHLEVTGAAYFDLDGDGSYQGGVDRPAWGERAWLEGEEWIAFSPQLRSALGEPDPRIMAMDLTDQYWGERDTSRQVPAAMEAHSTLPVIVVATSQDHLNGVPDHANITGFVYALMSEGAQWVRLNPDASYLSEVLELSGELPDNAANTAFVPGDAAAQWIPDEDEHSLHSWELSAAGVVELAERSWAGNWELDLEGRLEI